ncbi:MAG: hypothetical protein GY830_05005 [Bacteroidetes bacterium]|nr:hypothetical protein [Bacteroidota bacterium]
MKNFLFYILLFSFLNCSDGNINNDNNNNESSEYNQRNTGSYKDIKTEFGSINKDFDILKNKIENTTKKQESYNSKEEKSDSEYKILCKEKRDIVNTYFELYKKTKIYNSKIKYEWITQLQILLNEADKDNDKLKTIKSDDRFKKAKKADDLKENKTNLDSRANEIQTLIHDKNLINNPDAYKDKSIANNNIKYNIKAIIEYSNKIIKILEQIKDKRDGEEYSDNQKVSKEEITTISEKIDKAKEEFNNIKNVGEKSENDKEKKETEYGDTLFIGLDKIKEYISFDSN